MNMTRGSGTSTRPSTTVLLLIVLTVQSYLVREHWHSKSQRSKLRRYLTPQDAPAPATTGVQRSKLEEPSARRQWHSVRRLELAGRSTHGLAHIPAHISAHSPAHSPAPEEAMDVDCGRHRSPSCGECPSGRGAYDCGGDCHWDPDAEQRDLRCVAGAKESYTAFPTVSEGQVTYLHELLSTVTRAFEEGGVKYWLSSGTLLGAMRNRPPGIMRWDDDLDIGVTHDDFEKALSTIARNPRIECIRWRDQFWDGRKCGLQSHNSKFIQGKKFSLDIVEWHYVKNCHNTTQTKEHCGKGPHWNVYSSPRGRADWFTKRYFLASEVETTVPCQFWDLTLQCPRNSVAYLERAFAPDVMSNVTIVTHSSAARGPKEIALDKEDVNDHVGFVPGLNRELMRKLMSNPNLEGS